MLLSATSHPPVPIFLLVPSVVLLLAYLYALLTRPPLPTHAQISDPGKFGWPEWYTQGGKTPYDVKLGTGDGEVCDERRSVLLFIDLPYDHPRISHALDVLSTLEGDTNVELTVVSPWSEGWRDDQPVRQNIEDAGCGERVWRISDTVRDLEGACPDSIWISEIVAKSYGSKETLPTDPRANITILPQPHDLVHSEKSYGALSAAHGDAWEIGLFSHVLPFLTSSSTNGTALPFSSLTGSLDSYYPTRDAIDRRAVTYFPRRETPSSDYPALPWGNDWTIYRPTRVSPPPRHVGSDPLKPGSAYRRYWVKEDARRASAMRHAGVCLFEGWSEGVLDERLVQAMLSGCVVATVQPDVQHDVLEPLIIPLSKTQSGVGSQLPSDELRRILARTTEADLKRKALHAFIFARQKFVPIAGVRAVFDATQKWEDGGRGYLFPNGWRWTCNSGGEQPPWCI